MYRKDLDSQMIRNASVTAASVKCSNVPTIRAIMIKLPPHKHKKLENNLNYAQLINMGNLEKIRTTKERNRELEEERKTFLFKFKAETCHFFPTHHPLDQRYPCTCKQKYHSCTVYVSRCQVPIIQNIFFIQPTPSLKTSLSLPINIHQRFVVLNRIVLLT